MFMHASCLGLENVKKGDLLSCISIAYCWLFFFDVQRFKDAAVFELYIALLKGSHFSLCFAGSQMPPQPSGSQSESSSHPALSQSPMPQDRGL